MAKFDYKKWLTENKHGKNPYTKDYLNDDAYNERTRIGKRYLEEAIIKSRQENLEPPIVLGYSLGGIGAMYISILFPDIPVKVYNPII